MVPKGIVYFLCFIAVIWNGIWAYGFIANIMETNIDFYWMTLIFSICYILATIGLLLQIVWLISFAPLAHFLVLIGGKALGILNLKSAVNMFGTHMLMQAGPYIILCLMVYSIHGLSPYGPFLKKNSTI